MNTKHTRVVVALLLAVASLATMGFRAPLEDSQVASILPDHATCTVIEPSLTAIERLEFVDDHCSAALVDQVETEIDRTFTGTGLSAVLLDWFYAPSRPAVGGSVEYLEIVETDADSFVNPSVSRSAAPVESPVALSGPSSADVPLAGIYTSARTANTLAQSLVEPNIRLGPRVGFSGPSATDVPLNSVYTNAKTVGVLDRSLAVPGASFVHIGFSGPSSSEVLLEGVYTNAQPIDAPARSLDELLAGFSWRGGFSGPSAYDVPLVSVYTNAQP